MPSDIKRSINLIANQMDSEFHIPPAPEQRTMTNSTFEALEPTMSPVEIDAPINSALDMIHNKFFTSRNPENRSAQKDKTNCSTRSRTTAEGSIRGAFHTLDKAKQNSNIQQFLDSSFGFSGRKFNRNTHQSLTAKPSTAAGCTRAQIKNMVDKNR